MKYRARWILKTINHPRYASTGFTCEESERDRFEKSISIYVYVMGYARLRTLPNVQKWFVSFVRNVRPAKSSVKGHHFGMRGENKSLARLRCAHISREQTIPEEYSSGELLIWKSLAWFFWSLHKNCLPFPAALWNVTPDEPIQLRTPWHTVGN